MLKMTGIKLELMTDVGMFQFIELYYTILPDRLDYPQELHELHNDYPLATEKMKVTPDMLSPYCKNIQEQFGITIGQVAKLIPTLSSIQKTANFLTQRTRK